MGGGGREVIWVGVLIAGCLGEPKFVERKVKTNKLLSFNYLYKINGVDHILLR